MAGKKIERLEQNENDVFSERRFTRYEMEFIPSDDLDIETQVEDALKDFWEGVAKVASKGYAKLGRGYVFIQPNAIGHNRYSGELAYEDCFKDAEVEYVIPGSSRDFYCHNYLANYDPATEVLFIVDFSDGRAVGVTSFGEALNPKKAKSKLRRES
jgi:hypothetical protein